MQEILKINNLSDKIISLDAYKRLVEKNKNYEFILYSDNILEGISLLNNIVVSKDKILTFYAVVYEPIDQPIYIFKDKNYNCYSLKICGSFNNWDLPDDVHDIESFIDIPDYAIYSINNKKVVIAGENTETASVGNSQWQREGRKIGAARNKVPFIYQTFYSGKDESQGTIREATSLQVYNHLLYSVRYKTPSFVVYLDNNFEDGNSTRVRKTSNGQELLVKYIKSVLVSSVDSSYMGIKKELEMSIFQHMISYINEGKLKTNNNIEESPRLIKDFPIINNNLKNTLLQNSEIFIKDIVEYINNKNYNQHIFLNKYKFTDFNYSIKKSWDSYKSKNYISSLISHLKNKDSNIYSYLAKAKVGIAESKPVIDYLKINFSEKTSEIERIFSNYNEIVVMPLRIHKKSNGKLTFCPDPESGEIAAFAELLAYDDLGVKTRPVLGYCIVDPPAGFDINTKKETKLYKSIANYVDFLVINGNGVYTDFDEHSNYSDLYFPKDIISLNSKNSTEEVAIVSTFLGLSTIKADWGLCFIHTHHSSWQQLMVYKNNIVHKMKINRTTSKVDLVMQKKDEMFLVAEGKKKYSDFFASSNEAQKIKTGMKNTNEYINNLLNSNPLKIYSFICMIDVPELKTEFFLQKEFATISSSIKEGHLDEIIDGHYLVIAVYILENHTFFKLFFSDNFDTKIKNDFLKVFED